MRLEQSPVMLMSATIMQACRTQAMLEGAASESWGRCC